jgi:hypothetical protein
VTRGTMRRSILRLRAVSSSRVQSWVICSKSDLESVFDPMIS